MSLCKASAYPANLHVCTFVTLVQRVETVKLFITKLFPQQIDDDDIAVRLTVVVLEVTVTFLKIRM